MDAWTPTGSSERMSPATRSSRCWDEARWASCTSRVSGLPRARSRWKFITPAFADDEVFRRRFLREGTAAAAIEHPHILPVYAVGESDGNLFMAMRLVDGLDLREILRGSAELPLDRVEGIVGQVGGALDAAHARGLIHRDVKPGNIWWPSGPTGGPRLLLPDGFRRQHLDGVLGSDDHGNGPDGRDGELRPSRSRRNSRGSTDLYSSDGALRVPYGQRTVQRRSSPAILYGHLNERRRLRFPPSCPPADVEGSSTARSASRRSHLPLGPLLSRHNRADGLGRGRAVTAMARACGSADRLDVEEVRRGSRWRRP